MLLGKDKPLSRGVGCLLSSSTDPHSSLKHIHFLTAGVDHVASHAIITSSDIMITTSSGIHTAPIGEWVIMTSLAVAKHLPTTCQWQREHNWSSDKSLLTKGTDWVGKRVGIAGYGSIGRQGKDERTRTEGMKTC